MAYWAGIAVAVGVLLRSFFDVSSSILLFFILIASVLLLLSSLLYRRNVPTPLFLLSIFLIIATIGLARADLFFDRTGNGILRDHLNQEEMYEGIVSDELTLRENGMNVEVRLTSLSGEDVRQTGNKILIHAGFYPELRYGDRIEIHGKLQEVENFETDTGRIFNYKNYLRKYGIYFRMFSPEIEIISRGNGSPIKRTLFSLKHSFVSAFSGVVREPHASLLSGITVGAEESLGKGIEKKFRDTGIIHIVVLSGYNVTIVAEFFMRILAWAPFFLRSLFGALSIVLFAMLTGASATIVRASIMALLVVAARLSARRYDITRALVIAGALMVFHNPYILLYDPGFQLSFLATFGLIYLAPLVEKRLNWMPTKWQLREFATATISTQIFVLPLLLYMTGTLSVFALPVNLLILPAVPLAMFGGLVTGLLGFFSSTLSFIPAIPTYILLDWMLRVVDFFSSLPFATISIPTIPLWSVIVIYAGFAWWLWGRMRGKENLAQKPILAKEKTQP